MEEVAETRRTRVEAAKDVIERVMEKFQAASQEMEPEHQQQEQEGNESYLEAANDATLEAEILCARFLGAKTEATKVERPHFP
ncbi:hypothetical protein Y032_0241g3392 [Ancylostoma ceylanicum]|uniref:Uncharacterized protein n=1 Tax=Ancylostoma ceylanicum TaxID=53326 RepID=A0A016SDU5_9BILA|nr:hypothetical protein Y032_0241g3392 [Ancylostoma ceylanicum]